MLTDGVCKEWGTEYRSILRHEKEQFGRLPLLIQELCGDSKNGLRHTADIHIRRFWAPYLQVNVCITEKSALVNANTQLLNFTLKRFSHLKMPASCPSGAPVYYRVCTNALLRSIYSCLGSSQFGISLTP